MRMRGPKNGLPHFAPSRARQRAPVGVDESPVHDDRGNGRQVADVLQWIRVEGGKLTAVEKPDRPEDRHLLQQRSAVGSTQID